VTVSINNTQNNNTLPICRELSFIYYNANVIMPNVVMLGVVMLNVVILVVVAPIRIEVSVRRSFFIYLGRGALS